jgi:hypothetical protein
MRPFRRHRHALIALTAFGLLPFVGLTTAATAHADGPGAGTPWVVSVGDSYISGEAGRWAGNTNNGESSIDALGSTAYDDNATHTAEQIPRCHRSQSSEIHFGAGTNGYNLACSGAKTATYFDSGDFKPGLDFYSDSSGNQGQALMLQNFAASHNVTMVAVSIGGNDFNFGSVVKTCVEDFLLTPSWAPSYCSQDSSVLSNFSAANVAAQVAAIENALRNVHTAMANAGYADSNYSILVQNYPSPIPYSSGFRYSQSGFTRQNTGGCGFWDADANWANATALHTIDQAVVTAAAGSGLSNVATMDISSAFNGRRLCENTDGLLEEEGLPSWTAAGAKDRTEWINQIRTATTIGSDYYVQESLHPNYWGQLALRSCLRQAYNGGAVYGGACNIAGTGTDPQGEPWMSLRYTNGGGIINGGFETGGTGLFSGSLTGWQSTGTTTWTIGNAHSGNFAAELGSGNPTNGDSSISQTFWASASNHTLSFWYQNFCPDTVAYDWATATLTDQTTGTTTTPLPRTCDNPSGSWTQVTAPVTPGHHYSLTLTSHDDNYPGDPTYTLYDDVTLS